ncbi:MAG: hypothetical protein COS28_01265 [Nitrospirae bacterium CG02_land_8_20_14_3_00_44_33]|nr:MAG: hypothetical protein AUJ60_02695 [Nitrospirae bacterium CG1_02_44_142]PIV43996.1 MAG: hypothetical protein COS28_01265 [Nitrospirae bacterium CG02_land_8_20_14_3_00_44_33]
MDSITKSHLKSFIEKIGFSEKIKETDQFEYFVTYSILSHEVNSIISKNELENMSTGKSKGIDAIAFCINDKIVFNSEDIDDFDGQTLNVDVYFFQAKTSESFSDSEAANFLDVVIDFFSDTPAYNINELASFREIYLKLLDKIGSVKEFKLHCFYASLGVRQEGESTLLTTLSIKKQALGSLGLFSDTKIELVDKSKLINKHKRAINPLKATFKFENRTILNSINNVEEASIGFIPFSEFRKLIMDEEQDKIKSLFNDNLRDFLGLENTVNEGIKKTIEIGNFSEFSLLNNGITVVADTNNGKGNTLVLENYQIVNGCQTSNVLYECRNKEGIDNALIPLKVVITTDSNLRDSIILSTNSQSRITEEQLFALTEFQKLLEDFYLATKHIDNLYYERRTNQYASSGLNRNNIIEIKEQLKSFMAMFLDIPHIVAGNIGKVIKNYNGDFFKKEHDPLPYYIAGLISSKWDKLQKDEDSYREFNKYRYHLFMGFRYLIEDMPFEKDFIKNIKNYSIRNKNGNKEFVYKKLLDAVRLQEIFKNTIDKVINTLKKSDYTRAKGAYSNPITQEFIQNLKEYKNNALV